ncbi:MAG: hypothetical protein ACRD0K_10070 [Egibacteraceae bacterium]
MARSRSYWPVIRDARDRYGLSLAEGRAFWRALRETLDRAPYKVDLDRHPRYAARAAQAVREETRAAAVEHVEELPKRERVRLYDELADELYEEAEEYADYEETELSLDLDYSEWA